MATEAELKYIISVQDRELRELKKELRDSGKAAGTDLPKGVAKGNKSLEKLNKTVNIVGAALIAGIVVGAKKSIDAASDLNESVNKANVVFGKSAPTIQAWGKTAATSLGLSNQAALEAAGSIGSMLVPMGLSRTKAAGMSQQMVELAADMASFNNEDPTDMLDRIRAGLSGESEPLKKFGTVLSESRVQQFAWKNGIAEGGEVLTDQQKIMARYGLLLEDTKDQQGDFARTSDGLANSQRIAKAQVEDTAAAFGKQLIPIEQAALGIGLKLLGWTGDHQNATKALIGTVLLLVAALKVAAQWENIVKIATATWTAVQWLLNTAFLGFPLVFILAALVALGAAIVIAWKKSETFRKIVIGAFDAVKWAIGTVIQAVLKYVDLWLGAYSSLIRATGKVADKFLPGSPFARAADAIDNARERVRGLSDAIGRMKSKEVEIKVGLTFAGATTEHVALMNSKNGDVASADLVRGALNRATVGTIQKNVTSKMLLANMGFGAGAIPRPDVSPSLWNELGLARALGLSVSSTYRPGARVRGSGAVSDHSFYPSKAVDLAGSAAQMNRFALLSAGRPGVDTVIYSPIGLWKAGFGWGPISSATTKADHYSHVHVDTFGLGGIVTDATLAMIGERRGSNPEAVIPLGSRAGQSALADALAAAGARGGTVVNFNAPVLGDERRIAELVRKAVRDENRRNSRSL